MGTQDAAQEEEAFRMEPIIIEDNTKRRLSPKAILSVIAVATLLVVGTFAVTRAHHATGETFVDQKTGTTQMYYCYYMIGYCYTKPSPSPPPPPPKLSCKKGLCSCPQEKFTGCNKICKNGSCCHANGRFFSCDPHTGQGQCHMKGTFKALGGKCVCSTKYFSCPQSKANNRS